MTSATIHSKPKAKSTRISTATPTEPTTILVVKGRDRPGRLKSGQRSRFYHHLISKPKELLEVLEAKDLELDAKDQELKAKDRALTAALLELETLLSAAPTVATSSPEDLKANSDYLVAKTQAIAKRRALIDAGKLITANDLAGRMHITRQALSKAVNANRLFALQLQDDQFYPAFFADEHISRATFGRVCKALGNLDPWEKYMFFTRPSGALAKRTPIQALQHDQIEAVLNVAASFAG